MSIQCISPQHKALMMILTRSTAGAVERENHKEDKEAIEAFLTAPVDRQQLQELKTASSLVEAPNVDNKPKEEDLIILFDAIANKKDRNAPIVKAYKQGYSQHMIAKVLGVSQQAVFG